MDVHCPTRREKKKETYACLFVVCPTESRKSGGSPNTYSQTYTRMLLLSWQPTKHYLSKPHLSQYELKKKNLVHLTKWGGAHIVNFFSALFWSFFCEGALQFFLPHFMNGLKGLREGKKAQNYSLLLSLLFVGECTDVVRNFQFPGHTGNNHF